MDPNPVKTVFQVLTSPGTAIAGHWPETFSRVQPSAGLSPTAAAAILTPQWPQLQPQGTFAPQPWVPTTADLATFQTSIAAAMSATATAATAAGTPIDPKMLRVTDRRTLAKPINLGPSINGSGTDSGDYWVDTTDPDQMTQLLVNTAGAVMDLPDPAHLYAIPGPRWYRPWSPQIVLQNAGRSYRFGEDGRFDSTNGNLLCRTSGFTVYGIVANIGTTVLASAVLANAKAITSNASLPVETSALLGEAVLLDTSSVPVLAAAAVPSTQTTAVASYFAQAVRGLYVERLPNLSAQTQTLLQSIKIQGTQPSPAAFTPWVADSFEALFVDTKYSLQSSPIETDWELDEDQVEMTAKSAPSGPAILFSERSRVTATVSKVAQSTLVTRRTANPAGNLVVRQNPPNGLTSTVFQSMDVLSAPLVGFDSTLFAKQYRQRAGTLSVNAVSVFDIFGVARRWNADTAAGPSTPLTPRLPF